MRGSRCAVCVAAALLVSGCPRDVEKPADDAGAARVVPAEVAPAKRVDDRLELPSEVKFTTDADVVLAESLPALDSVLAWLRQNPEPRRVVIEVSVHAGDEPWAKKLSEKRAAQIHRYLMTAGAPTGRLEAKGLGRPADPRTPAVQFRLAP